MCYDLSAKGNIQVHLFFLLGVGRIHAMRGQGEIWTSEEDQNRK